MEYRLPHINGYDRQEWDWPFRKFNLRRDDLFTTLHDRFNMHQLPLQDPMAFHGDVCEAIDRSGTLEEFYSQMAERRAQRVKEMNEAWANICVLIASGPWVLACPLCYDPETGDVKTPPDTLNDSMPQKWALFNYFSRSLSFDTLIRYFDGYVRDRRKKVEDRRRKADERLAELRKRAAAAARPVEAAAQSPPEAAYNQPETFHDAPSSDLASDRPGHSSTRRRHEMATHPPTTTSPRIRKRRGDEDTQGPQRKRRRATSESAGEDDDAVWIAVETDRWEAEAPWPRTRQAEKRKRTYDDADEQVDKRPRRYASSQEDVSEYLHYHSSPDERENESSRPFSDAEEENEFLHHYDFLDEQEGIPPGTYSSDVEEKTGHVRHLDVTDSENERTLKENRHSNFETQWPMFPQDRMPSPTPSLDSFYTCQEAAEEEKEEGAAKSGRLEEGQTSSHENTEGRAANDTTDEAANAKKHTTKPRALRWQRVERRRSPTESEMSPSKEQPRHKKRQERKSVEQLLQSKRSSRRTAGQPLFFLDDNATPCVAGGQRRIRRR